MNPTMTKLRLMGVLFLIVGIVLPTIVSLGEKPIFKLVLTAMLLELFGLFVSLLVILMGHLRQDSQAWLTLLGGLSLGPTLPIQWFAISTFGADSFVPYIFGLVAGYYLLSTVSDGKFTETKANQLAGSGTW
ncbi:MAG: hypothetical protein ABJA67_14160 [Chthonomonadales bacterium]